MDKPLTLVDTGPNSGKALDELEQSLGAHGHRVEDLERIVVTHQHIDHLGLVDILARRSGAEVCALDLLAPLMEDFSAVAERDDVPPKRSCSATGYRPTSSPPCGPCRRYAQRAVAELERGAIGQRVIHVGVTLIDERFAMHERRARKIGRLIAERPSSAYEIAQSLWGNVAVTQAYLTLSEVLGHVDILLERAEVVEVEHDGIVRFESVRAAASRPALER
ncbi:MAG: MBL fold metallo-hydrolase [Solirubrobacterales bacterium]|nr:MBL fold metallo-hydrolase [Solirubrobacterales bacterium]